jgi:hypothetical protein
MNNIHVAPAASTISLIGLWMGVGRTKNCDAYVRNSGNEIREFLGRRLRRRRGVSLKRCEAWL